MRDLPGVEVSRRPELVHLLEPPAQFADAARVEVRDGHADRQRLQDDALRVELLEVRRADERDATTAPGLGLDEPLVLQHPERLPKWCARDVVMARELHLRDDRTGRELAAEHAD